MKSMVLEKKELEKEKTPKSTITFSDLNIEIMWYMKIMG